jgi:hypothetical protein
MKFVTVGTIPFLASPTGTGFDAQVRLPPDQRAFGLGHVHGAALALIGRLGTGVAQDMGARRRPMSATFALTAHSSRAGERAHVANHLVFLL